MRKKHNFLGRSKWFVLFLLLMTFWATGKYPPKQGEKNFFQVGKEVIKTSVTKHFLYSQSMILGIVLEQENVFFAPRTAMRIESFIPLEEKEHILAAGQENMESFVEENAKAAKGIKEEINLTETGEFLPVTEKQVEVKMEEYSNMESFVKHFFTVDSTTETDETLFQIDKLNTIDCTIDTQVQGPQILIYHTHSQEAFVDSDQEKEEDTIVGAGEILAEYLKNYGFQVYHHKGKYDVESRDYAYSKALPEIEKILAENPQIQVVIDLHRDAVAEGTRLVTQIQGKQVAKVMFFNGLSRIRQKGEISYLVNPYLEENLAFSFQMKLACDEYYPGFARNNYLRAYRYNMHLCPKTLLVELGAQTNTKEEIHNALAPLAHVLSMVLSKENTE